MNKAPWIVVVTILVFLKPVCGLEQDPEQHAWFAAEFDYNLPSSQWSDLYVYFSDATGDYQNSYRVAFESAGAHLLILERIDNGVRTRLDTSSYAGSGHIRIERTGDGSILVLRNGVEILSATDMTYKYGYASWGGDDGATLSNWQWLNPYPMQVETMTRGNESVLVDQQHIYHDSRLRFDWSGYTDAHPSDLGVRWVFDQLPNSSVTESDSFVYKSTTVLDLDVTSVGEWYFHVIPVRSNGLVDESGLTLLRFNYNPDAPTVTSATHSNESLWYANNIVNLSWTPGHGETGSVARSCYVWDTVANTIPTTNESQTVGFSRGLYEPVNGIYYFHVRTMDHAGNLSDTAHFRVNIGSGAPLQADFSTLPPVEGPVPLEVGFADQSTGSITNRFWDYDGDGTFDATNPVSPVTWTYTDPGVYDVTLEVEDFGGALSSTTLVAAITVNLARMLAVDVEPAPGGTVDGDGVHSEGTWAQLLAAPSSGYAFIGWGGDASGRVNPISIQMDDDYDVIAYFHRDDEVAAIQNVNSAGSETSVVVTCVFRYPDEDDVVEVKWQPALPTGWKIQSVSGEGSATITPDGQEIHYSPMPLQNPFEFTYEIVDPSGAGGSNSVSTSVEVTTDLGPANGITHIVPVPDPVTMFIHALASDDTDGDGLPDTWELQYFANSTGAVASADADLDGQSNLDEYIAGTIPTNAASYFCVMDFVPQLGSSYVVQWDSVSNRTYTVKWTDNLTNSFQSLEPEVDHPQNSYTNTVHGAEAEGYYKVDVRLK